MHTIESIRAVSSIVLKMNASLVLVSSVGLLDEQVSVSIV